MDWCWISPLWISSMVGMIHKIFLHRNLCISQIFKVESSPNSEKIFWTSESLQVDKIWVVFAIVHWLQRLQWQGYIVLNVVICPKIIGWQPYFTNQCRKIENQNNKICCMWNLKHDFLPLNVEIHHHYSGT